MKNSFLFVFFIFILSLNLVSAQLEIQRDGIQLFPTTDISGVSIQTPPTPEGNLNVNHSEEAGHSLTTDSWITTLGQLDTLNGTQFDNNGGVLTIDQSWGSSVWCALTGCSMTGNIFMGDFNITNLTSLSYSNWQIKEFTGHANLEGVPALGLFVERSGSGEFIEHMVFNPGGSGQATAIRRSGMIVDDSVCTGTNATNAQCYADAGGFNWTIDFDTSATGADWGVTDDLEVIGDVKARDTDGEVHNFNRELEIRDELYRNIVEVPLNSSYDVGTALLTINESTNKSIFINIEEVNYDLGITGDSITLTKGTNGTPIQNFVHYSNGGNPTLSTATSEPNDVAQIAQMLLGAGIDYGSIVGSATNNEFIRGVYNRFFDDGALYKSGFNINVTTDEVNFSTGTLKVLLNDFAIDQNHSTSGLAIEIHNAGDFHQHINDLSAFDTYATGESIGTNKYFNLVCGVAVTENNDGVMYCVIQNKPPTEHTTSINAETDNTYISFFPANSFIKKIYTPIVRVVIQAKPGGYEIQTLSGGELFFDLRGTITGAGAAPTAGVTALSQLTIDTNLDMTNPTTSVQQNITNADWGFFNNLNISGTIIGPGSNFAQYNYGANSFNGSGNFTGDGGFFNFLNISNDLDMQNLDINNITRLRFFSSGSGKPAIFESFTYLYLSGDGTEDEGLDFQVPTEAGNGFFMGNGGNEVITLGDGFWTFDPTSANGFNTGLNMTIISSSPNAGTGYKLIANSAGVGTMMIDHDDSTDSYAWCNNLSGTGIAKCIEMPESSANTGFHTGRNTNETHDWNLGSGFEMLFNQSGLFINGTEVGTGGGSIGSVEFNSTVQDLSLNQTEGDTLYEPIRTSGGGIYMRKLAGGGVSISAF